jgi:hypothetical protein
MTTTKKPKPTKPRNLESPWTPDDVTQDGYLRVLRARARAREAQKKRDAKDTPLVRSPRKAV